MTLSFQSSQMFSPAASGARGLGRKVRQTSPVRVQHACLQARHTEAMCRKGGRSTDIHRGYRAVNVNPAVRWTGADAAQDEGRGIPSDKAPQCLYERCVLRCPPALVVWTTHWTQKQAKAAEAWFARLLRCVTGLLSRYQTEIHLHNALGAAELAAWLRAVGRGLGTPASQVPIWRTGFERRARSGPSADRGRSGLTWGKNSRIVPVAA